MKQIVTGVVAHVDAGKTTLSEAMLYNAGSLKKIGRVDKGDAFLDPDELEKARGITIYSHQANLSFDNLNLTLLDTPGHMDFASQTEQVLSVLDYAILVVSATDGIQGYTRTLWNLLAKYQIPTFIFINKVDNPTADSKKTIDQLQSEFSEGCLNFSEFDDDLRENIAMQDDATLEKFLDSGQLDDSQIQQLIRNRKIFPCYLGSALKNVGIQEFLQGIEQWSVEHHATPDFSARVFKISHDEHGERLTWIRIFGGQLKTKDILFENEKINQIRINDSRKFELAQSVSSGQVFAVTGLTKTYPGLGLGKLTDIRTPQITPVLSYTLDPQGNDIHQCLSAIKELEDEDPQLQVSWSSHLQQIKVRIMGEIQLQILVQVMLNRFDLKISFEQGSILYKETITQTIEGVGHFEPLRHYSEVHLLMQPMPANSGLVFQSACSLDQLASNWQHQVLTNLSSKEHLGVLTGSPITDMKITLISGKASNVHSVGGDFKEATYRAVRQGLMMAKSNAACQLLEPWYRFRMTVTQEQVGRAMNDIQNMAGTFETPDTAINSLVTINGRAPVSTMQNYAQELRSYTHGQGALELIIDGYFPCHNAEKIVEKENYDPVADLENTPDSVFCAHGAGYPVPWDQVPVMAHVPYAKK